MTEARMGREPEVKGERGKEHPEPDEAGGRSRGILYTCWNDQAGNYLTTFTTNNYFTCWRCGALNWL
jgi:hypothetical protein